MSPSEALLHHGLKLGLLDDLTAAANRNTNPDLKAVQHMRIKWLQEGNGRTADTSVLDAVRRYSSRNPNNRIHCSEFEGGYCIVLVTAFMLRVHQYHHASKDVVFIDSTSHVDQLNCSLTIMVCPSMAGALPLAVLLTSGQSKQEYTAAFKLLQETLGQEAFFHQGYPCAFMTDDSDAERGALAAVWPHSKMFLCIFQVLQTVWRWLWNSANQVKLCDRKPLMNIMKRLVYASTKKKFENELEAMKKDQLLLQYGNVARSVGNLSFMYIHMQFNGQLIINVISLTCRNQNLSLL